MTEKSGLCLSGGGVKGFAHIGVLKALEENNITFDAVSGNSAGSLVGAAYALGYSSDEILEFCKNQKLTDILGYSSISKKYADVKQGENAVNMIKNFNPAINSEIIENFLLALIGDKGFDDMKIPFYCVAVNLKDGREIVFEDGELGKCCRASCSIPGVFTPVEYNDMILVDGMVSNNMVRLGLGAMVVLGSMAIAMYRINRRRQSRKRHEHALAQLETSGQQNAEFLSNVSHELRTPINMVLGISEVILEKDISPEVREDMLSIQLAGKRLSNQINNMLDYTEIVEGTLIPAKEPYMITSVLNDIITMT